MCHHRRNFIRVLNLRHFIKTTLLLYRKFLLPIEIKAIISRNIVETLVGFIYYDT